VQIYNKETLSKGGCLEICYGHKCHLAEFVGILGNKFAPEVDKSFFSATDAPVKSLTTKALPFWLQALD
jgi:hypothetical protein